MYLKWTNDLQHSGDMVPKLINYKVIRIYHIDILKVTSTYDYSYTYNTLSHLSIIGDW